MKLWDKLKARFAASNSGPSYPLSDFFSVFPSSGGRGEYGPDIGEITYFTCLKTLSEALGKMPVHLVDENKKRVVHDTTPIIEVQTNNVQTPVQFFTAMEYHRNHYGNAYAYIARDVRGRVSGLYPLHPPAIQIWIDNVSEMAAQPYYYYYVAPQNGGTYWLNPEDVIHVKSWITEQTGHAGKSVRQILAESLTGNKASQAFLNDLYQHGLTANAVVKYVGDLNREKQKVLLDTIMEQSRDKGRRMFSLPVGCDIQTLDLKLSDSQFFELQKYGALRIAAAFGVKPNFLNDYSKSSYANSASQNLSFYIDTLLYTVSSYEQEMNRKLLTRAEQDAGIGYKFNLWSILRSDPDKQAEILQKFVTTGIYSIDEARNKLDMSPCDGGDVHMIPGNYIKLTEIGAYTDKARQAAEQPMKGGDAND